MSVHPYSAIERVRQVRRVQRLSLLCVGSAFIALSLYQYRLEAHRAKTTSIVKKALVYCSAFEGQCEPEGEPRFCRENVPLPLVKQMERPLWYVPLRANGQHYALILRADTGRLCYVFNISPWENTAKQSVAPGLASSAICASPGTALRRCKYSRL